MQHKDKSGLKTALAAARAEIARLTQRAEKAEAERDEARLQLRRMEGFDCCTCFPCAIHSIETEQSALAARDAAKVAEGRKQGMREADLALNAVMRRGPNEWRLGRTGYSNPMDAARDAILAAIQKEGGE